MLLVEFSVHDCLLHIQHKIPLELLKTSSFRFRFKVLLKHGLEKVTYYYLVYYQSMKCPMQIQSSERIRIPLPILNLDK